ncbi:MAG: Na+/H+ antiporter subunit E [Nitrosospira sp.]|nr:Na+/H+ antiporter subunit E [Nitrosospira sp.]
MILRAILWRGVLLAALWCLLTEGRVDSWGLGVASAVLALAASLILLPPGSIRFSLAGLAVFLVYFINQSLRAGVRVALLALRPRLNIHPGIEPVSLRMPVGVGRVILVNTLNLLPGTLVVDLAANHLYLHTLDIGGSIEEEVRVAELRIAKMLGLDLDDEP